MINVGNIRILHSAHLSNTIPQGGESGGGAGEGWGTRGVQEGRPKGWGKRGGKFDSNDDKWITSDYMRVQGRRRISFTKKSMFCKNTTDIIFCKKNDKKF